jgi:4-amino-4-deoxy-L-arabinose transferase-like glycosyltransferase
MRYLLLLALALAMTIPGIASLPPLDRDESRFVQASRQMLESGDFVDIRFQEESRYKKPVGIYWLQSAAALASGEGAEAPVWVYRLVSVAGAAIAVLGIAWTGTALFGPAAGLVSAFALAAMFGIAFEARIAKTDAMLLAAAVIAQGALARIYVSARTGPPVRPALPWIFWIAQGAGLLLKGPVLAFLALVTIACLALFDRDLRWLKSLKAGRGLLLAAAVVTPWLALISWTSGGAFWSEAVGNDMLGKIAGGQESHGAPPGYYLLTYGLYVWPLGPLLLASGLAGLGKLRSDPRLVFLFAWYVPFWLVLELVPTKLPHYLLPAYPALALAAGWAAATAADLSSASRSRWQNWLFNLSLAGQVLVTLALAALALGGPAYLGEGVTLAGVVSAIVLAAAGWLGIVALRELSVARLAATAIVAAAAYGLVFGFVAPSLDRIWLTPRIVAALEANRPCPQTVLASVSYHEPSLVFMAGTETRLGNLEEAARHLLADRACAVALVPFERGERLAELVRAGGGAILLIGEVQGINYSKGDEVALALYRMAQ